jgi:hypothetical protein
MLNQIGNQIQNGKRQVKIAAALVLIVLLSSPYNLIAQQRGGRRGGGGGQPGGSPSGDTDPSSMKDFHHAIAVQATEDQKAQFMSWVKSAESARKRTTDMFREIENANGANGLSSQIASLRDAVDETQKTQEHFLRSLSNVQRSGLKEFTKKLEKADSAVLKELKSSTKIPGVRISTASRLRVQQRNSNRHLQVSKVNNTV